MKVVPLSLELDSRLQEAVRTRRTFAIISHPDAGKTTLTEKLLLYGGAIHLAGSVKARRAARHATSDWMKLEQERGISVTSSVHAVRVRRLPDQPARHAGPRRLLRGHLPHADRGRQRGDAARQPAGRRRRARGSCSTSASCAGCRSSPSSTSAIASAKIRSS